MAGYVDEAAFDRIGRDYPLGQAFLDGPARLSRDALTALQDRRFRRVMARAWQVPFYDRLWREQGLEPGDIDGLQDIGKLPTFSKTELMASIERAPPYGDYHGVDFDAPVGTRPHVVMHTTSGTTGRPQPLFFGAFDREVQNALLARAYLLQGMRDDDVVHSVYGFGMVNGGHYIREAILHFTKAMLLPAGTGLETRSEAQVELMRMFSATALVGFVDYIRKLGDTARAAGLEPGRDIPIRMISGHLGLEDRGSLAEAWGGAEIFDWYGVGDTGTVAAEGPDHDGLYLFEDAHYVEVIDPDTDATLTAGQAGSICVTCLFKESVYPIIRFDTKDLTQRLVGRSGIGIGFDRIAGHLGRSDNMVKLRGINVYPTAIGSVLAGHSATTGEFVCRVGRDGGRDQMTVLAEVTDSAVGDVAVVQSLAALLRQALGVEVVVETVGLGETAVLTEIDRRQKPLRLLDERKS